MGQFDGTVTILALINILVWIVTVAIAWAKLGGRLDTLEYRVGNVEHTLTSIAASLQQLVKNERDLAVLAQQVVTLEQQITLALTTIELLRRGEGYITGPRRGNLEGEYSHASR